MSDLAIFPYPVTTYNYIYTLAIFPISTCNTCAFTEFHINLIWYLYSPYPLSQVCTHYIPHIHLHVSAHCSPHIHWLHASAPYIPIFILPFIHLLYSPFPHYLYPLDTVYSSFPLTTSVCFLCSPLWLISINAILSVFESAFIIACM